MNKILNFFNKLKAKREQKNRREQKRNDYINTLPAYYPEKKEADFTTPTDEPNVMAQQMEMFNMIPKYTDEPPNHKDEI